MQTCYVPTKHRLLSRVLESRESSGCPCAIAYCRRGPLVWVSTPAPKDTMWVSSKAALRSKLRVSESWNLHNRSVAADCHDALTPVPIGVGVN